MTYEIANIPIALPDEFATGAFGRALQPFASLRQACMTLRTGVVVTPDADYRELDRFDFPDVDADCRFGRDERGYLLEMMPRTGELPVRFRLAYNSPEAQSDITPDHNPALLRFGLWTVYNITALAHQAVAIHASVIVAEGGGCVLFLGESGTGKSTHTRLWREHIAGAELLNDDSPIIRVVEGQARAFGSPWSGKTPCYRNENHPIRGIVRLSQAPHNRIRPLRPLEAIGALLPSCPPAFARDERLQDAVCALLSDLLSAVPAYHLECLPNADAARLSHDTIFAHR